MATTMQRVLLLTSFFLSFFTLSVAQSATIGESTATAGSQDSSATTIPSCANTCFQTATRTQSCAPGDQSCLCSYSTQIQESIFNCLTASGACGIDDKTKAFDYYPQHCKQLNLAVETNIPTMLATAGGATSTKSSSSATDLDSEVGATQTSSGNTNNLKNIHAQLQLPAILGIILAVVILVVGVGSIMIWSYLRRRQMVRGPRRDLGGEFVEVRPRPFRSKSNNSNFVVRPPPIEKDSFGGELSRSSTLVPPPPVAKDEKRSSDEKRDSVRNNTLRLLLGSNGLRSSLRSSKSASKKPSLVIPPLNIRQSQQDQLRMSKF